MNAHRGTNVKQPLLFVARTEGRHLLPTHVFVQADFTQNETTILQQCKTNTNTDQVRLILFYFIEKCGS